MCCIKYSGNAVQECTAGKIMEKKLKRLSGLKQKSNRKADT